MKIFFIFIILCFTLSLEASGLVLHKGWNLTGSSFGDINISQTIPNSDISWVFRNSRWYEYSDKTQYKNILVDKFNGIVKKGEGFWVYTDNNLTKSAVYDNLMDTSVFIKKGWNLISIKSDYEVDISNYFRGDIKIAWIFKDNHWSAFSSSKSIADKIQTEGISLFRTVHPFDGFWVYSDKNQLLFGRDMERVEVLSKDTNIKLNKSLDALDLNSSDIFETDDSEKSLLVPFVDKNISNKALFVDGIFKGVIESVEKDITKNSMRLIVDDAIDIDGVYSDINLTFNSDKIQKSLSRMINSNSNLALYDSINKNHLKLSIKKTAKMLYRTSNAPLEDMILRIDIPKGYKIPIKRKLDKITVDANSTVDTDFTDAKVGVSVEAGINNDINLSSTKKFEGENYTVAITTEDSYIEFGIGTKISFIYDKNLFKKDFLAFDLSNSAYFESNLHLKIEGTYSKKWSSKLELIRGFDVEIVHPYSNVAKVYIGFKPDIILEASGEIKGVLEAQSYSKREGVLGIKYDSIKGVSPYGSTTNTPTKAKIDAKIIAKGNLIVYPEVSISPEISFLRVIKPIKFGVIRSGVKVDGSIQGTISENFNLINDESQKDAEAQIKLDIYPYSEYLLKILIGDKEIFNSSDNFQKLYEGDHKTIFDWRLKYLHTPSIDVSIVLNKKDISFKSVDNDKNLYFIYTLNGTKPEISNGTIWHRDDTPIDINETTVVKVLSVLENNSSSIWNFGTSFSAVATKKIVLMDLNDTKDSNNTSDSNLTDTNDDNITYTEDNASQYTISCPTSLTNSEYEVFEDETVLDENRTLKCFYEYNFEDDVYYIEKQFVYINDGYLYDGIYLVFYTDNNHRIKQAVTYKEGVLSGFNKVYYNNNANSLYFRDEYMQNKKNGLSEGYYEDRKSKWKVFYEDDKLEGMARFWSDINGGFLEKKSNYKDGKKEGLELGYYSDGTIFSKTPYLNNQKNGIEIFYFRGGAVWMKTPYSNGLVDGDKIVYYEDNHQIKSIKHFVDDKLQGLEINYRQDGTKETEFNHDSVCALNWEKFYTIGGCLEKMTTYKEVTEDVYGTIYTSCEVDNTQTYECAD